jgi:hypothetical protein
MLPNFLCIGAAKCGSTWFYKALRAHPEIFVPPAKDIYYFDEYYSRGLSWYKSFFKSAGDRYKAIGELSHNYLFSYEASERIKRDLNNPKLIACLRNPADRAFSAYLFMKRNGTAASSFRESMKQRPEILERGKYLHYVQHYLKKFGSGKFKIFLFDDLVNDPYLLSARLYEFLEVNTEFVYEKAGQKVLPASRSRFQWLGTSAKKSAKLLRNMGFANVVGKTKNSFVYNILFQPIVEEKKGRLSYPDFLWLNKYYKKDIEILQDLLKRDLSPWTIYEGS